MRISGCSRHEGLIDALTDCAVILETLYAGILEKPYKELTPEMQQKLLEVVPRFREELFDFVKEVRNESAQEAGRSSSPNEG